MYFMHVLCAINHSWYLLLFLRLIEAGTCTLQKFGEEKDDDDESDDSNDNADSNDY